MSKKKEDDNVTESSGWVDIKSTQNHSKGSPGVINVQDEDPTDTEGGDITKDLIEIAISTDIPTHKKTISSTRISESDENEPENYPQKIYNDPEIETPLCGQCCCNSDCVIF